MVNIKTALIAILVFLFLGLVVCVIYFVVTGFSQEAVWASIGIAALSAFFSAISAAATFAQARELENQRKNAEGPNLILYFIKPTYDHLLFVIENIGGSPALNVHLTASEIPEFASHYGLPVNAPIPIISPKDRIFTNPFPGEFDYGAKFIFEISYSSPQGVLYNDRSELDISYLENIMLPTDFRDPKLGKSFEMVSKRLEGKIQDIVNKTIYDIIK